MKVGISIIRTHLCPLTPYRPTVEIVPLAGSVEQEEGFGWSTTQQTSTSGNWNNINFLHRYYVQRHTYFDASFCI